MNFLIQHGYFTDTFPRQILCDGIFYVIIVFIELGDAESAIQYDEQTGARAVCIQYDLSGSCFYDRTVFDDIRMS
jgi:hypothetical protein